MMKRISFFLSAFCILVLSGMMVTACDEHEFLDTDVHPGHVLCADGSMLSEDEYLSQPKTAKVRAVGVVYSEIQEDGSFLAVLLEDGVPVAFCDSVNMKQGTSCSVTAQDGFDNTCSLQNTRDAKTHHGSPLGDMVFSSHVYGQSDYIPSVSEARLLFASRHRVNGTMTLLANNDSTLNVNLLDTSGEISGWYWTSTEVESNPGMQAWLFSMATGVIHETPKTEAHPFRAIVRVRPYGSN